MSALFAYAGKTPCRDIIIDGAERLCGERFELSGIVMKSRNDFELFRMRGNSQLLSENSKELKDDGCTGIAESACVHRCKPSGMTAPPAVNESFAVALDGIVENFETLKTWAMSPLPVVTDEELLLAVLTKMKDRSPLETVSAISVSLQGAPSYVFLTADEDALYAKSGSSPLVVGMCEDGFCLSSELCAVLPFAKKCLLLENGECAKITNEKAVIYDEKLHKIKKPYFSLGVSELQQENYTLSDRLASLPFAVKDSVSRFVKNDTLLFDYLKLNKRTISKISRIILTGANEEYRACRLAAYYLEALTDIPAQAIPSGELRYSGTVFTRETLLIAVSSSGEDKDTLACIRRAKRFQPLMLGVSSSAFSTLEYECKKMLKPCHRRSSDPLYSYISSSLSLLLFALWAGNKNDIISDRYFSVAVKLAELLPGKISSAVKSSPLLYSCAKEFLSAENIFTAGIGADCALSYEAASQIRTALNIHASAFSCSALADESSLLLKNSLVAVFITNSELLEKNLYYLRKFRSLGAQTVIYTTSYIENEISGFDLVIPVTDSLPVFDSLVVLASLEKTLDIAKDILSEEQEQQAG